MPKIKNRRFQPVLLMLEKGKTLYLQSRGESSVATNDIESPSLRQYIEQGDIGVLEEGKSVATIAKDEERRPGHKR